MRHLLVLLTFLVSSASFASVELHAHLFMNEGMTWLFFGDFFGPLKADSWDDGHSSQANPETVNRSGIKILVVSLYANPLFVWDMRESVRRQIALTERFVQENPQWIIARSSGEAAQALSAGKRILILSLEGAAGIIENEDDLREFVDRKGLRIVTPLHLMDDEYGGVALLRGAAGLVMSPWAWIKSWFIARGAGGVRVNRAGLHPRGEWLIDELLKRKVWIDLAHSSDRAQDGIVDFMKRTGRMQKLLYTHIPLRKYLGAERGITLEQLQRVKEARGFVGIMPSEAMLVGTSAQPCSESLPALALQYREMAEIVGADSIGLGSDYNGTVPHLKPSCLKTGTSLDTEGFWNIGQAADVWTALNIAGAPVPPSPDASVARFLDAWASAEAL